MSGAEETVRQYVQSTEPQAPLYLVLASHSYNQISKRIINITNFIELE